MSLTAAQTSSIFDEAKARVSSLLTLSLSLSNARSKDAGGSTAAFAATELAEFAIREFLLQHEHKAEISVVTGISI